MSRFYDKNSLKIVLKVHRHVDSLNSKIFSKMNEILIKKILHKYLKVRKIRVMFWLHGWESWNITVKAILISWKMKFANIQSNLNIFSTLDTIQFQQFRRHFRYFHHFHLLSLSYRDYLRTFYLHCYVHSMCSHYFHSSPVYNLLQQLHHHL